MKKIVSVLSAALLCCILMTAPTGTALAQDGNNSTAQTNHEDDDDDADYGWIGLIGLAGLLGLRKRDHDDRTTRPASRV